MSGKTGFRLIDFLVILLCLSGAAVSVYLFYLDLFQTFNSRNEEPVGTIIIRNNIVQRRMADRVLWDRLFVESPVYAGDLIRVAELSDATLNINENHLDLGENTIVRILRATDSEGRIQIELSEGSLGITTGAEGGALPLTLNLMGRVVEAGPGTALTAVARDTGITLQVSEGRAVIINTGEEESRELASGGIITLDTEGTETREPAVVVSQPRPNARYLKSGPEPFPVAFAWNRINLEPGDTLRLEIALDRNFTQTVQVIENLDDRADTAVDAGIRYWRLLSSGAILSTGRITVVEAAGPALLNPAMDRLFSYQDAPPDLRFEWSELAEASHYILEASDTPDFTSKRITTRVETVSFSDSSLGEGTWYWRVMPVFPAVYEGSAAYSRAASFRIDRIERIETVEGPEAGGGPENEVINEVINEDEEFLFLLSVSQPAAAAVPPPEPPPPEPEIAVVIAPPGIRLISPAAGASIAGLTALRQQTEFRWDIDREPRRSRFVLSRNSNPLQGRPEVEILNPGRTVRLDRLGEGVWYWTVEAQDSNGLTAAAAPRRIQVLAIPLLPAPGNRVPAEGQSFGIEELRTQRNIVFRWAAVQGANAYIFTLYQQTAAGRREIFRGPAEDRTTWTLDDLSVLDNGTFVWQVEAVNLGRNNAIEQRGRITDSTFVMDIPLPGPVMIEEAGILYGN
jgi:hypothetical protein